MADVKKRNWAFLVYPESCPSDWVDILNLKGVPCAISPLHDKDLNPTGEPKKAHYHVILSFGSPTTFNNVKNISDEFNGTIPIRLESVGGYFRYLTHKDNPEKAQYDESLIRLLNGFDPATLLTETEVTSLIKQLINVIELNQIFEFDDLVKFLNTHDLHDCFVALEKHPYFISLYLKSRRYKKINSIKNS